MTTGDGGRPLDLFDQAIGLEPAERRAFLRIACAGNDQLRARVEAMLAADARSAPLLDAPADRLAALLGADGPALVDRRIGPYRILEVLGRGGMGIVCLAERDDVGMRVALKLVAGGLAEPERIDRFLFERRILAQFEHPNIARLLDAGVAEDGTPWLAMEYVPGETIDRYCARHRLTIEARLALSARVCDAVAHAHRHLIVHRDIKPSNVLVGEDGEPRLVDFGIAKLLDHSAAGGPSLTKGGSAVMTPQYASPEQLLDEPITTASDVYQLGILLFELLTGERLRPARSDRVPGQLPEPVPKPSRIAADAGIRRRLAGDIDTIVEKATERVPERRYQGAAQLADDVARHLAGRPVLARPATPGYRLVKLIRRHRTGAAAAVIGAVAGLGFVASMAIQTRRVERQRVRAEQVSDLLAEVFASADPTVSQGDSVTIQSILDRGADRVRANPAVDAEVRARLLRVIAQAYQNLGQPRRAAELAGESVALLRSVLPAGHRDRLDGIRFLSGLEAELDHKAAALALADEALVAARDLPRSRRAELALILGAAGFARQRTGDVQGAQERYEEAMAIYRSLPDSARRHFESTLTNLGYLARARGDRAAAESHFREALALRQARFGTEHSATAKSMLDVASVVAGTDRLEEAERLVADAIAIQRRIFAGPSSDLALGLDAMARVLSLRGQHGGAESAQREAVDLYRRIFGDGSATVALALVNLGVIVQRVGRLDEAAELYREAIDRYRALVGDRHVSTAITRTNLAYTDYLRRRFVDAEAGYRNAIPILDSLWMGTSQIASTLVDFTLVLTERDKCGEAEPLLRRALDLVGNSDPGDVAVLRPKRLLGNCLFRLGQRAPAESLLVDVHRELLARWGPDNRYTRETAADLALVRRSAGPASGSRR